ncbi:MAG TPA: pilus assembly protein N-terminal domain-containing protein [Lacipirellula sp.]
MYVNLTSSLGRRLILASCLLASLVFSLAPGVCRAQQQLGSVVYNVTKASERLEMTVNTSQILTLGTRIPRIVVNNPELVTARPISENQIQIAAKKSGVTQINLWDEKGQVYTVDLLIFGDVRELEVNLRRMFPSSSIRVIRLTNSLVLEGQVDRPEIVTTIRTLAEDYAPKVVNNMTVGGAQQVVLKVKVMEVSRTKLRKLGFDFDLSGTGGFLTSGAAGVLTALDRSENTFTAPNSTLNFDIIDGNTQFLGVLEALQQNNLVKTLANPTLVTVSGRPASFNSGGEIFFQVNNGVSGSTVESEKFGTLVHFVPIVLGDGRIRLEVRPTISELDDSTPIGGEIFRTKVSEVDTGVEMMAGQTLAIAGLIQTRVNAQNRGLPYLADIPVLGLPFRGVREEVEEVELLILVTPEFGEAMDPHEVPPCGPGMETMSPSNSELYCKGHIEVPACGPCGASEPCRCNAPGLECHNGFGPCGGPAAGGSVMATDAHGQMPGRPVLPSQQATPMPTPMPADAPVEVYDGAMEMPGYGVEPQAMAPRLTPLSQGRPSEGAAIDGTAGNGDAPVRPGLVDQELQWQSAAAPPSDPNNRHNPTPALVPANRTTSTPGLIGPVGYDVQK